MIHSLALHKRGTCAQHWARLHSCTNACVSALPPAAVKTIAGTKPAAPGLAIAEKAAAAFNAIKVSQVRGLGGLCMLQLQ